MSDKDSLTAHYSLSASDKIKTAFMFRIKIENREESSSFTSNRPLIMYKELPEGIYTLTISAFDPMNKWTAEPAVIKFKVNNRESYLLKEIKKYKELAEIKDTVKVANTERSSGFLGFDITSLILGLIVGLVSIGIFYIIMSKKKTKNKTTDIYEDYAMQKSDSKSISYEQYEELATDNGNLRAEIAALRGQIDALQTRGDELTRQNRKLQQHVEKLQNNKKELEELQSQKDDLFAVIIHDIKNPASLIKSLVELLRSYDLSAVEQQEVINDLFETSRKIISLSQEVTKVLALESNRLQLNVERTQINEVVKDLARRNSIAANNKDIKIILELDENIPPNFFDANKIDEVIDNLLSNAIKFSEKKGQVRILTKKENNNMIVEISDNGLGLSEDDVQKAFQRGVKLSAVPTAGESSSGFGLWIVKKLVEAHKGKVWIRSALGRGSTFAFSIPYIEYPEEEDSEETVEKKNKPKDKNISFDDTDSIGNDNNISAKESQDEDRELKI
jgi:signal transduction histidine kinase